MHKRRNHWIYPVLVLGLLLQGSLVLAQTLPPQAEPGAIIQHDIETFKLKQRNPWLSAPIRKEQLEPPQEPVINYLELSPQLDLEGEIMHQPALPPIGPAP
jgi:hypothetical protein